MKVDYLPRALKALEEAPPAVRRAFFKQVGFLEHNLHHPSLHAKKYDEARDIWQA
jgi:mRNA-degrading endonuclease RelE of RelBE toxin-antitoxin system